MFTMPRWMTYYTYKHLLYMLYIHVIHMLIFNCTPIKCLHICILTMHVTLLKTWETTSLHTCIHHYAHLTHIVYHSQTTFNSLELILTHPYLAHLVHIHHYMLLTTLWPNLSNLCYSSNIDLRAIILQTFSYNYCVFTAYRTNISLEWVCMSKTGRTHLQMRPLAKHKATISLGYD